MGLDIHFYKVDKVQVEAIDENNIVLKFNSSFKCDEFIYFRKHWEFNKFLLGFLRDCYGIDKNVDLNGEYIILELEVLELLLQRIVTVDEYYVQYIEKCISIYNNPKFNGYIIYEADW